MSKLRRGEKHSTLGVEVRDEAYTRGKAERWAQHLVNFGLQPGHLCVEFGCGSLWAAEPVIRYLQAGCFFGLDVTDQFYELGVQRIGALVAEKQVRLAVISEQSLREVAALRPDFLFSRKVLSHVSKENLPQYLANLTSLMQPGVVAVLDNTPTLGPDGEIAGLRHSVEDMRPFLPPSFEVQQHRYAALVRHLPQPGQTGYVADLPGRVAAQP